MYAKAFYQSKKCSSTTMTMILNRIIYLFLLFLWATTTNNEQIDTKSSPICQWINEYYDNDENVTKQQQWNLVWHDEFESRQMFDQKWTVENEKQSCTGNWLQQEHCNTNRPENLQVIDGHLLLMAKHEPYYDNEFTAASITTNDYFTFGRYEIRASNPIGNYLRTSVFTRNQKEPYWHENGQIDIFSYVQGESIIRGVHYADSTNFYEPIDQPFSSLNLTIESLNDFHLYGVEWNNQSIRFFFDDFYSSNIEFSDEKKYLKPFHQIRLQIGVGGIFFPVKNLSEKINWKCPTFMIDYIRIYQYPAADNNNENSSEIIDCNFNQFICNENDEMKLLKNTCEKTRQFSKKFQNDQDSLFDLANSDSTAFRLTNFQLVILLISILIIMFALVSIYLIFQMKKFGTKVVEQQQQQNQQYQSPMLIRNSLINYNTTNDDDGNELYEIPVYDYDALETELERSIINKHQDDKDNNLISTKNEYLEIEPSQLTLQQTNDIDFNLNSNSNLPAEYETIVVQNQ